MIDLTDPSVIGEFIIWGFMTLMLLVGVAGYFYERAYWNNGICEELGKPWMYFASASDGSRGYNDGEDNTIWVSWPYVDSSYKKEDIK